MPSPKRWFPVSHDLFTDPELWAVIRQGGDRAALLWLWILSQLDQGDNRWIVRPRDLVHIGHLFHMYSKSVRKCLALYLQLGWISVATGSFTPPQPVPLLPVQFEYLEIRARNYAKYHKRGVMAVSRVARQHLPFGMTPHLPSVPFLSEPSDERLGKEHRRTSEPALSPREPQADGVAPPPGTRIRRRKKGCVWWEEREGGEGVVCRLPPEPRRGEAPLCAWHHTIHVEPGRARYEVFCQWLVDVEPWETTKTATELWYLSRCPVVGGGHDGVAPLRAPTQASRSGRM